MSQGGKGLSNFRERLDAPQSRHVSRVGRTEMFPKRATHIHVGSSVLRGPQISCPSQNTLMRTHPRGSEIFLTNHIQSLHKTTIKIP
jgi:hypothetical protein